MKARLVLLAMVALVAVAAKKPEPFVAPVEAISRGDADGAFTAALDAADRLRVAFVTRHGEPPGDPELYYREQSHPGVWSGDELVLAGAPEDLKLTGATQPAIVYRAASALRIAERGDDHKWTTRELVAASDNPLSYEVLGQAGARRLVVVTRRDGKTGIRRIGLEGVAADKTAQDFALPRDALQRVAVAAARGGEHVLYQTESRIQRVTEKAVAGAQPSTTLAYTRITSTVLPAFLLTQSRDATTLAIATLVEEPVIAWLSQRDARTRLHLLIRRLGRFGAPEILLDTDRPVEGLALVSNDRVLIVAALIDQKLVLRRYEAEAWGEWMTPPGFERSQEHAPIALVPLIDSVGNARVVTRELTVGLLKRHRIVEWLTPAGIALTPTR